MKQLRYKSHLIRAKAQSDVIIAMTGGPNQSLSRRLAKFCLLELGLNDKDCNRVISRIMQAARRRGEVVAKGHRWYRLLRSDTND